MVLEEPDLYQKQAQETGMGHDLYYFASRTRGVPVFWTGLPSLEEHCFSYTSGISGCTAPLFLPFLRPPNRKPSTAICLVTPLIPF